MFQLIVAVISIALVAALAIASIYYGGSAFNKGSLRANVTTLVNAGQQISGAQALYRTDAGGTGSVNVAGLQPAYLSAAPSFSSIATGGWELAKVTVSGTEIDVAVITLATSADKKTVCDEVSSQAGGGAQFYCASAAALGTVNNSATADRFVFKL